MQTKGHTTVEMIRKALSDILESDTDALLMGEDIADPAGGAFKVTKGLSTVYGNQVIQTPISEAGFIGVATGLAYMGFKPIAEIMFGDFLTLIADPIINSASKFDFWMRGGMPGRILIRAPVGAGRGYGPIHSQCLEKLYFGWPNVHVIATNLLANPYHTVTAAYQLPATVKILIESKLDYPRVCFDRPTLSERGFRVESIESPLPEVRVSNGIDGEKENVTILCYGPVTTLVLDAAFSLLIEDEITSLIHVPTQISPLDTHTIFDSVERTSGLVVVEEGYSQAGWGSYLLGELVRAGCSSLRHNRARLIGSKFTPIPAGKDAESSHLPSIAEIQAAVREVVCA